MHGLVHRTAFFRSTGRLPNGSDQFCPKEARSDPPLQGEQSKRVCSDPELLSVGHAATACGSCDAKLTQKWRRWDSAAGRCAPRTQTAPDKTLRCQPQASLARRLALVDTLLPVLGQRSPLGCVARQVAASSALVGHSTRIAALTFWQSSSAPNSATSARRHARPHRCATSSARPPSTLETSTKVTYPSGRLESTLRR